MSELRLLPCPFCGHEADFQRIEGKDDPSFGAMYVECSNCHCCTPLIFPVIEDVRPALSDVWNRRQGSLTPDQRVGAVCHICKHPLDQAGSDACSAVHVARGPAADPAGLDLSEGGE